MEHVAPAFVQLVEDASAPRIPIEVNYAASGSFMMPCRRSLWDGFGYHLRRTV